MNRAEELALLRAQQLKDREANPPVDSFAKSKQDSEENVEDAKKIKPAPLPPKDPTTEYDGGIERVDNKMRVLMGRPTR